MARSIDVGALIEGGGMSRFQVSLVSWLCVLMAVEGFDMQVMAFAAPTVLKEWGVSRAVFGPVLSASLFGYMLGAFALASAADKLGRKTVILAGLTIFGVFTLVTPVATDLSLLMVLRFLAGCGLGAAVPTGVALNAEYVPTRVRATAIGAMYVTYNIGAAGGGFLAGWLIPKLGWHSIFIIGGLAPLILAVLMLFNVSESVRFLILRGGHERRIVGVLKKLAPKLEVGPGDRLVVGQEERHAASPLKLFTDNRAAMTVVLWLAIITSFMGHHFLTNWLPTVLSDAGVSNAVIVSALFPLGGALGSLAVGNALDRRGLRMVALAFLVSTPFVFAMGQSSHLGGMTAVIVFLAGFFVLGGQLGLNASAATLYPTFLRSTGAGWALGIGRVGSIMGPIVGGLLIASGISQTLLFLVAACPMLACALCILLLQKAKAVAAGDAPPLTIVPASGALEPKS
jgi:AAHS family 4-hydroxybenzoate transporter-like MFS transporter